MSLEVERRSVRDIVDAARAVEERRAAPFSLDIGDALATLARLFPRWTSPEDLTLDAVALNALSRALGIQEGRLRYEATLFLADPEGLVERIGGTAKGDLAAALLPTWRPVVELEQVTTDGLALAYRYWLSLPPWEGRWPVRGGERPPPGEEVSEEELAQLGILSRQGFLRFLGDLWDELKEVGSEDYRRFIEGGGIEGQVLRAYGVSFLVTYGYADLLHTDGRMVLMAHRERVVRQGTRSLPLVVGGGP
jgi:hypothetical protein